MGLRFPVFLDIVFVCLVPLLSHARTHSAEQDRHHQPISKFLHEPIPINLPDKDKTSGEEKQKMIGFLLFFLLICTLYQSQRRKDTEEYVEADKGS